jgi:hypothetical protein
MARRNFCSAFKNFITDRTSQSAGAGIRASIFNSCNDAKVRPQEVPIVHAPCYIIALSRMRSRFAQYKVCWLWDEWETYFADVLRTFHAQLKQQRSFSFHLKLASVRLCTYNSLSPY